jgi:hypothetical protein
VYFGVIMTAAANRAAITKAKALKGSMLPTALNVPIRMTATNKAVELRKT